jgi:4-aminobutyrate aminotransferase / (S)-3-amino-2-methylpropionate transaminase / 5-aminovalerate transaminase
VKYEFSLNPVDVPLVYTKYRKIKTSIPCCGTKQMFLELKKYESRAMHGQMPIIWHKAKGFNVFDIKGNKWIDFTSTIFVANTGHANKRIIKYIRKILKKPLLHTYAYVHELRIKYIKHLIKFSKNKFEKVFLMSSGTEATEAALKIMRMSRYKKKKRLPGIICIEGNYHGMTMGSHMMSTIDAKNDWVGYRDPNMHYIRFPYPWRLKDISGRDFLKLEIENLIKNGVDIKRDICGFMLETYQGWGAVFYPNDFVSGIEEICKENNILFTFDEMQSGFARTGKNFGYEHYNVEPDLICCGKGMGGGVPLSGILGSSEIMDIPEVGEMSSTHSSNPLVCAAGLAVLFDIERKNLVTETKRKGNFVLIILKNIQKKYKNYISNVCGKGLVFALLFKDIDGNPLSFLASMVAERCMQKGVLVVHTGRESIKIAPPLIISDEALREGIQVIDDSIGEILKEKNDKKY